jgi:hypothetical protein
VVRVRPESDGPVWIGDLPDDKREAVFARIKAGDVDDDDDLPFSANREALGPGRGKN